MRSPEILLTDPAGAKDASPIHMHGIGARFVYILRSDADPSRHCVGRTADVDERLEWHSNESAAARFERYLKSGSGRAFAKRHFGRA